MPQYNLQKIFFSRIDRPAAFYRGVYLSPCFPKNVGRNKGLISQDCIDGCLIQAPGKLVIGVFTLCAQETLKVSGYFRAVSPIEDR